MSVMSRMKIPTWPCRLTATRRSPAAVGVLHVTVTGATAAGPPGVGLGKAPAGEAEAGEPEAGAPLTAGEWLAALELPPHATRIRPAAAATRVRRRMRGRIVLQGLPEAAS